LSRGKLPLKLPREKLGSKMTNLFVMWHEVENGKMKGMKAAGAAERVGKYDGQKKTVNPSVGPIF
jgi:hypothetical protein